MTEKYRRDQRLKDTPPKALGQRVPAPLSERIDQLCAIAYDAGEAERPSKMVMLAALLLATPTDGHDLRTLLDKYGNATVGDALPWLAQEGADVIELPRRTSGPRSGSSA